MNENEDIVMQETEDEKRVTPLAEEGNETLGLLADSSIATASNHKALPASIIPPNKASTAPSQEVIDRFAPGSAPHWVGAAPFVSKDSGNEKGGSPTYVKGGPSPVPRNLPVKRYDGEPLSRSDLQHNVLCHLFNDTTRCFRNPRPGPLGPEKSTTWKSAVPVYPCGMAKTCSRPSDETEEEKEASDKAHLAFESAPFLDGEVEIKKEDEIDALSEGGSYKVPTSLRAREGYPPPGCELLTFKELYIEALMHSGKCTKAMRDKVLADEEFAEDFAKVCLLVNVGRINTTLAFYPEMKTILRSYHPLPALQRNENTRRHLQDAPRMKSLLKSVLLDGEKPSVPGSGTATGTLAAKNAKTTANDVAGDEAPGDLSELVKRKTKRKDKPVTSVITVIFLLSIHSTDITTLHFNQPHDFFSLFFPHPDIAVPSRERARTFLWLVWQYLEGGATLPPGSNERNPFGDEGSEESVANAKATWDGMTSAEHAKINTVGYWKGTKNPEYAEFKKKRALVNEERATTEESVEGGKVEESVEAPPELLDRILAPRLNTTEHTKSALENVDTEEEIEWGLRMREERGAFLIRFQEEEQAKIQEGEEQRKEMEVEGSAVEKSKEKAGKKRTIMTGGGSSYPLANILAAANAEKAAGIAAAAAAAAALAAQQAAESASMNGGKESNTKRKRVDGSAASDDEDGDSLVKDKGDLLWDLDLTLPDPLVPNQQRGRTSTTTQTSKSSVTHSLPRLAWRRILERAQRGVGDASYESDDESVALDEARDERPRVELTRILKSLRQVRTNRGDIVKT
ncbi:hypothetical protein CBS101457_000321 [Exobasidium rhododendri]|nr:hypothetical protein CBS101457_000321 [Exobasidium rhododendri]